MSETLFYFVLGVANSCIVCARMHDGTLSGINGINLFAAFCCAAKMAMV